MRTPVMDMFGLDAPFFAFSYCGDGVVEVRRGGGMGTIGTSHVTTEQLEIELSWIDRHAEGKPYGVDVLFPSAPPQEFENLTPETAKQYLPREHRDFVAALLKQHDVPEFSREESEEAFRHYMNNMTKTHREAERRLDVVYRHPQARMIVSGLGTPPAHVIERSHRLGLKVCGLIGHPRHAKRQADARVH